MKLIASLCLSLFASMAHGNVLCTVNRENPENPNQYDRVLFNGEVADQTIVIVKKDAPAVALKDLSSIFQIAENAPAAEQAAAREKAEQALGSARVIFISAQPDATVSIAFTHFEASSTENLLPSDFVWAGSIDKTPALAIDGANRLAVSCYQPTAPTSH